MFLRTLWLYVTKTHLELEPTQDFIGFSVPSAERSVADHGKCWSQKVIQWLIFSLAFVCMLVHSLELVMHTRLKPTSQVALDLQTSNQHKLENSQASSLIG